MVYWERRRKCVKRFEGVWLATRKKNIFLGSALYYVLSFFLGQVIVVVVAANNLVNRSFRN